MKIINENTVKLTSPDQMIYADKIASSAAALVKGSSVRIANKRAPRSGDVVAVRVIENRQNSNLLELGSGRLATVNYRDVIIGVLGNRRALKGFVGTVPGRLRYGDQLHILNLGGVIGRLGGSKQGLDRPVMVEYLGTVTTDEGISNISNGAVDPVEDYLSSVPLILVAGTCMQAGKTKVAGELVKMFRQYDYRVAAAKLTGVACLRDTLLMEDYGAVKTLSFLDCGLPSTVGVDDIAPLAKGIVQKLNESSPDVIVIELGDGLLGHYNVDSLFKDKQIMAATAAIPVCANDFVGVYGAIEFLKRKNVVVDVISGPATDSAMAIDFIETQLATPAANALNGAEKLFEIVIDKVEQWQHKN